MCSIWLWFIPVWEFASCVAWSCANYLLKMHFMRWFMEVWQRWFRHCNDAGYPQNDATRFTRIPLAHYSTTGSWDMMNGRYTRRYLSCFVHKKHTLDALLPVVVPVVSSRICDHVTVRIFHGESLKIVFFDRMYEESRCILITLDHQGDQKMRDPDYGTLENRVAWILSLDS